LKSQDIQLGTKPGSVAASKAP